MRLLDIFKKSPPEFCGVDFVHRSALESPSYDICFRWHQGRAFFLTTEAKNQNSEIIQPKKFLSPEEQEYFFKIHHSIPSMITMANTIVGRVCNRIKDGDQLTPVGKRLPFKINISSKRI